MKSDSDTNEHPTKQQSTSSSSFTKIKIFTEKLVVYPKSLNTTQHTSFQFDCIYTGPNYLTVSLVWLKNNVRLNNGDQRVFTLDYKQSNNTRISLLKFAYSLSIDTGQYKCFVAKKSHLNDYFNLNIIMPESKCQFLNITFFLN